MKELEEMKKAFVIKNKEGKYLAVSSSDYEHYWSTIDFAHYFRFLGGTHDAKQEAEEFRDGRYPDCEVVEITIAEGDLEQENAELKNQIEQADEQIQFMLDELKNRETCGLCEKLENKQIKKLKEQLTEQIDYKDEYYYYWQETKKELAIREKALELALANLYYADKEYYIGTSPSQEEYVKQQTKYWIEQAKESINEDRNKI